MKEMREGLEDYLSKDYPEEDLGPTEEKGKNERKIKTYVIESNLNNPLLLQDQSQGVFIKKTDDPSLDVLSFAEQSKKEVCYLDRANPRFWLLHSVANSATLKYHLNNLISKNSSNLDHTWFYSSFLENKCALGRGDGFILKFRNSFLPLEQNENEGDEIKRFSMLFWGAKPSMVISGLKQNPILKSGVTLSHLRQIFNTRDGYVKETVNYHGNFVLSKGNSIPSHFLFINNIVENYQNIISKVEDDYRIRYEKLDNGFTVKGTYIVITFGREISDFKLFLRKMLSCTQPFRLFGIPTFENGGPIRITALDLHTNHRLNIELFKDKMRVYLNGDSCGNVITRLVTNLQMHYDSQVQIKGYDDERFV